MNGKGKILILWFFVAVFLFAQVPFSARMNGGKIHYRDGRYERAKEQFELALKERPDSPEAHFWLGLALSQLGDGITAAEHFLFAFQNDSNLLLLTRKEEDKRFAVWSALSQKSQHLIISNAYEDALPYAEMTVKVDETRPLGYTLLAQVYSQLNKLDKLQELGRGLISEDSLSPQGYNILGIYYFTSSKWDSAAAIYQKAGYLYEAKVGEYKENLKKEIKRPDAERVIERLIQYQKDKDVYGFRTYVEDSLRLKKSLSLLARLTLELYNTILEKNFALFRTASSYLQASVSRPEKERNDYLVKAETVLNYILKDNPKDLDAKYNLGFVEYSLGKVEEAALLFRELVETKLLFSQLPEKIREELTLEMDSAGDKIVLPLSPEIKAKIKEGDFAYLYRFDTLSPLLSPFEPKTLENLYLLLGASYVRIADLKKAKENYDKAIECFLLVTRLNPESVDAYQNLVVAYREKGDKKMAEKMYLKMEEIKKKKGKQ
uniref:Tetratricopeptide repeat protein n=1 Tax=candidate division WOR-3 bacterium TaxID=2052148 RepID=A0A7C3UV22_UNCW3